MENPYENLIKIIDLILQKMEIDPDAKSFRIDLQDVPSDSIEEKRGQVAFLDNLKKRGALYDFERFTIGSSKSPKSPSSLLFYYTFTVKPNKAKLIEERKRLANFDQERPTKRGKARFPENKGPIKKLELVKPKAGNKFKVVINEDYRNPIDSDKAISSWDLLFRVAEGDIIDADNHKNTIDYFNFNEKRQLYTTQGHSVTKVLKVEGGYISPAIEIKMITEKAFQQRANKS